MRANCLADARPLSVTKHVDKIQVGRDERLERAVGRQGFNGAAPVAKAELTHFDGSRLAVFLRCQQSRVRVSHRAAGGSVPAEILQNKADSAAWSLLA